METTSASTLQQGCTIKQLLDGPSRGATTPRSHGSCTNDPRPPAFPPSQPSYAPNFPAEPPSQLCYVPRQPACAYAPHCPDSTAATSKTFNPCFAPGSAASSSPQLPPPARQSNTLTLGFVSIRTGSDGSSWTSSQDSYQSWSSEGLVEDRDFDVSDVLGETPMAIEHGSAQPACHEAVLTQDVESAIDDILDSVDQNHLDRLWKGMAIPLAGQARQAIHDPDGSDPFYCRVHGTVNRRSRRDSPGRRHFVCPHCKKVLEGAHRKYPYPTAHQKKEILNHVGMERHQLNNWFYNKRRKPKPDTACASPASSTSQESRSTRSTMVEL